MDIYSILEASDISLIILLDKEASMNNITLIIWEIEKIFGPIKSNIKNGLYGETAYKFFKYANVSSW